MNTKPALSVFVLSLLLCFQEGISQDTVSLDKPILDKLIKADVVSVQERISKSGEQKRASAPGPTETKRETNDASEKTPPVYHVRNRADIVEPSAGERTHAAVGGVAV
jgi:hypothetical protein